MDECSASTHACIRCKQVKPVSEFYRRSDTGKLKNTCKACIQRQNHDYARNGPQQYGRYNRYDLPDGRRRCRICGEVKPTDEFRPRKADGSTRRNECWDCFKHEQRDRYRADPDVHRDRMRKATYGLAPGEYDRMHAEQGGLCAICGEPETSLERSTGKPRGLFVDHHHETGRVRALLCMRCNMGIGHFRERPELLDRAIDYLNRHAIG